MTDDTLLPFALPSVQRKKLTAAFDGGRISSDGGVMLLGLAERRIGVADKLAAEIADRRDPTRVVHSLADILRARILAIACGYEDADDLDHLRSDPALKLACGHLPDSGRDLCSQPTMSRWENAPTLREVIRLMRVMVALYCSSYDKPPAAVTLDIDDTLDVVHGHQQLSMFNAHYDERCFLPIHVYDTATSRPVAVLLRPGKTPSGHEIRGHLRRLVREIRRHWPHTRITLRGDSHYGRPEVMDWCDVTGITFVFGLSGNDVLRRLVEPAADDVRVRRAEANAAVLRGYTETRYGAKSWCAERRVAARIEATSQGLDIRYVVTSLMHGSAEWVYASLYCARGQAENLIKLHKGQLASDRTSCRSPLANQIRLLLHTAAYCWCGRPPRASMCQNEVVSDLKQRRPPVDQLSRIGMDTSKHIFQLYGVNAAEAPVLRRKLRRKEMVAFFGKLAPTVIAIEACGASHHWARLLQLFGHSVKLIPPQLVKPYVKRGKNDAADAEALCEAMSRPTMRFVPMKTAEQQAALMLAGVRDRLIRNRTQLANTIRGYAAEFGLASAKGMAHLAPLLDRIQADEGLPVLTRELFAIQTQEYAQLQAQIEEVDAKLMAWHRADECSQRLVRIAGIGPIGATLLKMKTPAPELFRSGRQFAAWIGLTPKDHSTAGKVRLGVITRAGDEGLRSVLVVGATAVIQKARRGGPASPWLTQLLKRKSPKLAAVALANKMARIAWKLMVTGETYAATAAAA